MDDILGNVDAKENARVFTDQIEKTLMPEYPIVANKKVHGITFD